MLIIILIADCYIVVDIILIYMMLLTVILICLCSEYVTTLQIQTALIHPVAGRTYANKDCLFNSDILCC